MIDYEQLSPKIRNTVRWLNEHDFLTCDSGDGTNYDMGMEGALPYPHVFMIVANISDFTAEADRLQDLVDTTMRNIMVDISFRAPTVEASYCPGDGVCILSLSYFYDRILEHAGISY